MKNSDRKLEEKMKKCTSLRFFHAILKKKSVQKKAKLAWSLVSEPVGTFETT